MARRKRKKKNVFSRKEIELIYKYARHISSPMYRQCAIGQKNGCPDCVFNKDGSCFLRQSVKTMAQIYWRGALRLHR